MYYVHVYKIFHESFLTLIYILQLIYTIVQAVLKISVKTECRLHNLVVVWATKCHFIRSWAVIRLHGEHIENMHRSIFWFCPENL